MGNKRMLRGTLMTLGGGTLWGFSGTCGQYLLQAKGIPAEWLVAVRLLTSGMVLLAICLFRRDKNVWRVWKRDTPGMLIFGMLGMSACQYTYFAAITYSNAGTATVLEYLSPVLVLLYLCLRERRRPRLLEIVCIALALAGTFLIATHGHPGSMALSEKALFWGLLAAAALSLYTVQPVRLLERYGAMAVTAWGMLLGGATLMAVFRPWRFNVTLDAQALGALAIVILIGSVLAFTIHLEGIRCVGPKKGSLFSSVEPVSATVFAVLLMGASFQPMDLAGFACILSTIFLLSRDKSEN